MIIYNDILTLLINELDVKSLFKFSFIDKNSIYVKEQIICVINSTKIIQKYWKKYRNRKLIRIYAMNYNVLRIMSGIPSLSSSSS